MVEIFLEIKPTEHAMKQDPYMRFAVFCHPSVINPASTDCFAKRMGGWISDTLSLEDAKAIAAGHTHAVIISFFPDDNNPVPPEFLELYNSAASHQIS